MSDNAGLHTIAWTLGSGPGIEGGITCHAGAGSACREACECDGGCICDGATLRLVDFCNPLAWIENDDCGLVELYEGSTPTPLRDGPVEFTWEGDYYGWRYIDDGAA